MSGLPAEGRLDFDGYDETTFEEFCFELLHELEFVNVDWRKGTGLSSSPADRGRDIVAQLERTDVDGCKHLETWFVDCKHFKRGVPPEKLQALLSWAQAERHHTALVIASNFLSNPAKDYLRDYEEHNRPPFRIKFWERPSLDRLTRDKREFLAAFASRRGGTDPTGSGTSGTWWGLRGTRRAPTRCRLTFFEAHSLRQSAYAPGLQMKRSSTLLMTSNGEW